MVIIRTALTLIISSDFLPSIDMTKVVKKEVLIPKVSRMRVVAFQEVQILLCRMP